MPLAVRRGADHADDVPGGAARGILVDKTRRLEVPLDDAVRQSREEAAAHRARDGGVPHQRSGIRADRAAAQSQAQQGAAREATSSSPSITDRHAARRRRASACRSSRFGRHSPRVTLRFGYMETPNVPQALAIARKHGWQFDIMSTSFFLSRRALQAGAAVRACRAGRTGCSSGWRAPPTTPPTISRSRPDRVVEVGTQVTI